MTKERRILDKPKLRKKTSLKSIEISCRAILSLQISRAFISVQIKTNNASRFIRILLLEAWISQIIIIFVQLQVSNRTGQLVIKKETTKDQNSSEQPTNLFFSLSLSSSPPSFTLIRYSFLPPFDDIPSDRSVLRAREDALKESVYCREGRVARKTLLFVSF